MGGEQSPRAGTLGMLLTTGKYLFFGGTAFTLDLAVLSVPISTLGYPMWFSAAVAFTISTVFAFFTRMRYTFRSNASTQEVMVRYGILSAASMVSTAVVVNRFNSWWDAYVRGEIFSTGITTLRSCFIMEH